MTSLQVDFYAFDVESVIFLQNGSHLDVGPRGMTFPLSKFPEKISLSYASMIGRLKFFRLTEIRPFTFGDDFMKQTLVQDALKTVQSPQVLVNIISKRVRQLGQGFRPLIAFDPKLTFMDVALKEVAEGKLGYEMIEVPSAAGTSTAPVPVKKSRKSAAAAAA
jgi:DNA-directed RNA polymerase subunit omega